jgi:alpha-D-ribose 1-methylphosphonate 5-triphosphate synthase subunit PhnG
MQGESAATVAERPEWLGLVTRLTSGDARQALDQMKGSPLVSEGRVCLIGLDAIRHRMGSRWAGRRETVFAYAQQTLRRQIGAHGFALRISEIDFLVAQPAVSRLVGQVQCLNCLRDILDHFLGEAQLGDLIVHEVMAIGDGEIDALKLDVGRHAASRLPNEPATASPAPADPDRWAPFAAQDGRTLRASCALEPVFQLKTFGRIGYRLTRRVLAGPNDRALSMEEQRQLSSAEIEKIDFATLARGLNRLEGETDTERQPSLILPVSYVTLANQRGRNTLADFLRAAQGAVQRGLICEVCDIEGVPPSALVAAISRIRPFSLFVVGRLANPPAASMEPLKDVGLNGFSIERPAGSLTDAEFAEFARTVTLATKPAARGMMFFGLTGAKEVAMASLYGATHASFAPGALGSGSSEISVAAPL